MNNETLKTDLCSRLPYGVLVETTKWQNNGQGKPMTKAAGKLIGYSERTGYEVVFNEDDFAEDFHNIKPILFPISCLTKEITVNGETFVPAIVLFGEDDDLDTALGWGCEQKAIEFILNENRLDLCYPLSFWEKMNQLHINYRLSSEQFIQATNEYA